MTYLFNNKLILSDIPITEDQFLEIIATKNYGEPYFLIKEEDMFGSYYIFRPKRERIQVGMAGSFETIGNCIKAAIELGFEISNKGIKMEN